MRPAHRNCHQVLSSPPRSQSTPLRFSTRKTSRAAGGCHRRHTPPLRCGAPSASGQPHRAPPRPPVGRRAAPARDAPHDRRRRRPDRRPALRHAHGGVRGPTNDRLAHLRWIRRAMPRGFAERHAGGVWEGSSPWDGYVDPGVTMKRCWSGDCDSRGATYPLRVAARAFLPGGNVFRQLRGCSVSPLSPDLGCHSTLGSHCSSSCTHLRRVRFLLREVGRLPVGRDPPGIGVLAVHR